MVRGPKDLHVVEIQVSPVVPGEVAVAIAYGGNVGSDLQYWQHGRSGSFEVKAPLVLGHEAVGRVRELGEGVTGWSVGDTVAIHPATPCPEAGAEPTGMHLVQSGTYRGSASTTPHTQGGLVEVLNVQTRQLRRLPKAPGPARRCEPADSDGCDPSWRNGGSVGGSCPRTKFRSRFRSWACAS